MIKKTTKKINTLVTEDVLCNKCGHSLVVRRYLIDNPVRLDHGEEGISVVGLSNVTVHGAYESTHLEDAKRYNFSLCEKCIKELMDSFVIPPDTEEEHF